MERDIRMTKAKAKPKAAPKVDDRIVALERDVLLLWDTTSKIKDLQAQVTALQRRVEQLESPGVFTIAAVENS